eukprot:TRINITY_DN11884_c0_g1_i1.p1 TRINITY_DN11884_c0_g1~~TRINITY_DN11884_c0_g1_i1.p1  ORF type:complete len:575 (-),score=88.86 TRINITY_DN11884_c0_g1_i1:99-1823(-)
MTSCSSGLLLKCIAAWSLAHKLGAALGSSDVQLQSCEASSLDSSGPDRWDKPMVLLQLKLSGLARSFTSLHEILHDGEDDDEVLTSNGPTQDNSTSSVKAIERNMEKSLNEKTKKNISSIKDHLSEPRRHKNIVQNRTNATKTLPVQAKEEDEEEPRARKRHHHKHNGSSLKNVTVETTAFADAKYQTNATNDVVVHVDIAEPNDIVSVYVMMFVPMLMGWFYYWHRPSDRLYSNLLQLSVTALSVGNVLVNQSLCVLMKAPMALTAVHATAMMTGGLVLACVQRCLIRPAAALQAFSVDSPASCLYRWLPASMAFAAFQVMDHAVSYYCSISERTVLGNLSPMLSMMLEVHLALFLASWPKTRNEVSLSSKMALLAMVFGALVFALQYPDFNSVGVSTAMFQNITHIVYRLTQRYLLGSMTGVSVAELCALDGLVLLLPSALVSMYDTQGFWTSWGIWLNNPSVVAMLFLSSGCYAMGHFTVILMLRASTATALVVMTNVANALCVILGIYFFGDNDFERPMAFVGIMVSIAGGCCFGDSHGQVQHDSKAEDCLAAHETSTEASENNKDTREL